MNPGSVVSKFGIFAGRFDGNGLDSLPSLTAGLERLLSDAELRRRLGKEGRRWVEAAHNRRRFIEAFSDLCGRAGVLR